VRAVPPRDPRFRPYRISAWVLYFAAIAVSIGLLVASVVRTLRGRPRKEPPAATSALPTRAALRNCMDDLDALYQEQNQRAWAMGSRFEGSAPLSTWKDWSPKWEERVSDLSDRCRLDVTKGEWAQERADMAAARDAMLALHRAYTAQVNRFAAEQGDLARAAAEAMRHAREAARPSR
jgi:hypothetical protein